MSTFAWAQLEARVSALERRQINNETRIEEVAQDVTAGFKQISGDMTTSFTQISKYLSRIEDNTERRFQTIETVLGEHSQILDEHTKRLGNIETLLTQILARLPENR